MPAAALMVAVDIGTTATKVVAFTTDGTAAASAEIGYLLHAPRPGFAEQDPEQIAGAVYRALSQVVATVGAENVAGVSFSSAMHTLMGLDGDYRPVTPVTSWADTRCQAQVQQLRADGRALDLHRATGTPVHPMSPMVRLAWFAAEQPDLQHRVRWWCGIKDYVLWQLSGELVMDHSLASSFGLLELATLTWHEEALQVAGIDRDRLPTLVPTTHILPMTAQAASAVGLPVGTPLVAGGGDGPLANLGVGAVRPGMAACSLGTSGALRVVVNRPAVDDRGRVFCYAITPDRWVVGGAVNNGGIVMRWALQALAPDLAGEAELLELAAQAPVGSGGVLMLPYLLSERAPRWESLSRGAIIGLTRDHGRHHLLRAALEGVGLQLSLVLESMRATGLQVDQIRATGGVMRSPLWQQLLADVFDLPIDLLQGQQGSSLGAAILGMYALGMIDSLDAMSAATPVVARIDPVPEHVARYATLRPIFHGLYDALAPAVSALSTLPR